MSPALRDFSSDETPFSRFLRDYPSYAATAPLDDARASDYARLDRERHVYLDYTGGGQYAESQLRCHFERLKHAIFGNPHSTNPASAVAGEQVERARAAVLSFFHASPDDYFAIFTPNATGALRLVGESYPFEPSTSFLLTVDNHNSVNGIREFARARGARTAYAPILAEDLRADRAWLRQNLVRERAPAGGLFAFPAQSNFTGVQHPLEMIEEAREAGWDVLLDAAAFVPTNRLDLSRWRPEFVAVSFYKMFGYPTGVGCLLMRRDMLPKLRRPWFAGGAVRIVSVRADAVHRPDDETAFEDGTLNYLDVPAIETGLAHVERLGIDRIHERVRCLTGWLLERLAATTHENGRPLVQIHGPAGLDGRGGTIALNVLDPRGRAFDILHVESRANESRISLRTGCFCNPGVGEVVYGLTRPEIETLFAGGDTSFDDLRARIRANEGREVGAIRVSMGVATNFQDVARFAEFVEEFRDQDAG